MRNGVRSWHWLLVLVPAYGYVLYWSGELSDRLARLERLVRSEEGGSEAPPPDAKGAAEGAHGPIAAGGLEELRSELTRLHAEVEAAKQGLAVPEDVEKDQILDVVNEEATRLLDRHLEFHRERWIEHRERTVDDFAKRFKLEEWQRSRMEALLVDEVDQMVKLARDPALREDPDRAAEQWEAALKGTDREVGELLDGPQRAAWLQARSVERAIFFPWLPHE